MELAFASVIVVLVAAGMGLGVMLRGRPLQTSCSGVSCLPDEARCEGCPHHRPGAEGK
jgi:hypothetical protein